MYAGSQESANGLDVVIFPVFLGHGQRLNGKQIWLLHSFVACNDFNHFFLCYARHKLTQSFNAKDIYYNTKM